MAGYDIELQKTLQDTDFLIQQMQWREKMETFTENDEDELNAFSKTLLVQKSKLESLIADQLAASDLDGTADSIRKLKFILKLQDELALLEERLLD